MDRSEANFNNQHDGYVRNHHWSMLGVKPFRHEGSGRRKAYHAAESYHIRLWTPHTANSLASPNFTKPGCFILTCWPSQPIASGIPSNRETRLTCGSP